MIATDVPRRWAVAVAWLLACATTVLPAMAPAMEAPAAAAVAPATQPAEDATLAAARRQYEAMQAVAQEHAAWMQQATAAFAEKTRTAQTPAERTALQQAFQQEQRQKTADMQRRLAELKGGNASVADDRAGADRGPPGTTCIGDGDYDTTGTG